MAIGDLGRQAEVMLPRLLVAVAVTVALVLRPELLSDLEHSPRAWIVAAGVVLVSAVVRRLTARWSPRGAPWAAAVVTLTLFGVIAAPTFRSRTLHEDFPAVAAPVADVIPEQPSPSPSPSPSVSPSVSPSSALTASQAPAPRVAATVTAPVTATAAAPVPSAPAVPRPTASPTPSKAPVATLLSAGQLEGLAGHQASGRVALYRVGDGTVLRFEDVDISGGAKPSVHLVPPGQHRPEGGVALGPLKAERGSFSYAVPASVDGNATWTVLVWCEPYDVPIGAADLH